MEVSSDVQQILDTTANKSPALGLALISEAIWERTKSCPGLPQRKQRLIVLRLLDAWLRKIPEADALDAARQWRILWKDALEWTTWLDSGLFDLLDDGVDRLAIASHHALTKLPDQTAWLRAFINWLFAPAVEHRLRHWVHAGLSQNGSSSAWDEVQQPAQVDPLLRQAIAQQVITREWLIQRVSGSRHAHAVLLADLTTSKAVPATETCTREEAARIIGVSPKRFSNLHSDPRRPLPPSCLVAGRRGRYYRAELLAYRNGRVRR